ncbi:MAG: alpha/beta fold hydrolase [Ornithinibacter sp.]
MSRPPGSEGATVVFLPGLGLDARSWAAVRAALALPSIVVSLPSMGRRAGREADLQVEAQRRRVLPALPATGDLVLVGHSAGCPVAIEVAAHHPRVVGLVLVGPVTDPRARSWPRMLAQWLRTAVHEQLWEVAALVPQYRWTGSASIVRGMTQVRRYRTTVAMAQVSVPTRVIRGSRDRVAPEGWCVQLTTSPLAELVSVPRAGHMVPLTHPKVVADSVEVVLRRGVDPPLARVPAQATSAR